MRKTNHLAISKTNTFSRLAAPASSLALAGLMLCAGAAAQAQIATRGGDTGRFQDLVKSATADPQIILVAPNSTPETEVCSYSPNGVGVPGQGWTIGQNCFRFQLDPNHRPGHMVIAIHDSGHFYNLGPDQFDNPKRNGWAHVWQYSELWDPWALVAGQGTEVSSYEEERFCELTNTHNSLYGLVDEWPNGCDTVRRTRVESCGFTPWAWSPDDPANLTEHETASGTRTANNDKWLICGPFTTTESGHIPVCDADEALLDPPHPHCTSNPTPVTPGPDPDVDDPDDPVTTNSCPAGTVVTSWGPFGAWSSWTPLKGNLQRGDVSTRSQSRNSINPVGCTETVTESWRACDYDIANPTDTGWQPAPPHELFKDQKATITTTIKNKFPAAHCADRVSKTELPGDKDRPLGVWAPPAHEKCSNETVDQTRRVWDQVAGQYKTEARSVSGTATGLYTNYVNNNDWIPHPTTIPSTKIAAGTATASDDNGKCGDHTKNVTTPGTKGGECPASARWGAFGPWTDYHPALSTINKNTSGTRKRAQADLNGVCPNNEESQTARGTMCDTSIAAWSAWTRSPWIPDPATIPPTENASATETRTDADGLCAAQTQPVTTPGTNIGPRCTASPWSDYFPDPATILAGTKAWRSRTLLSGTAAECPDVHLKESTDGLLLSRPTYTWMQTGYTICPSEGSCDRRTTTGSCPKLGPGGDTRQVWDGTALTFQTCQALGVEFYLPGN